MAGFMKTINLWDNNIIAAIEAGTLVLRAGQWVSCGPGVKSRFVGINASGTLDVVHGGSGTEVNQQFSQRIRFRNLAAQRAAMRTVTPPARHQAA